MHQWLCTPKPRHPEAPDPLPGDEVMYVDLSRDKLEDLYKNNKYKKSIEIMMIYLLMDLY